MSNWAYAKCKNCGDSVHIGQICTLCGGDPHGVIDEMKKELAKNVADLAKYKELASKAAIDQRRSRERLALTNRRVANYRKKYNAAKKDNT